MGSILGSPYFGKLPCRARGKITALAGYCRNLSAVLLSSAPWLFAQCPCHDQLHKMPDSGAYMKVRGLDLGMLSCLMPGCLKTPSPAAKFLLLRYTVRRYDICIYIYMFGRVIISRNCRTTAFSALVSSVSWAIMFPSLVSKALRKLNPEPQTLPGLFNGAPFECSNKLQNPTPIRLLKELNWNG